MKLSNEPEVVEHDIDIIQLIEKLKETNKTIFWTHINNQIFIYKPLGRKDHKEIAEDEDMDNISKEDEVVKKCLLYPTPSEFDLDNTEAGVIAKLFKTMIDNSYMTDLETRSAVMDYFRSEMFDFQEQVTCIINEAFPQFDIEDIENWGIERTAKYLSRAEWKLQNFRGATFNHEALEQMKEAEAAKQNGSNEAIPKETDSDKVSQSNPAPKKERMTPDKLAELAEMKRKFPEIDWDADVISNEGIDGMRDAVDSKSVALRVGG